MTSSITTGNTSQEWERQLRAVLAEFPQVEFATLFGSRAEGTATLESDIDIAIASSQGPLNKQILLALQQRLIDATGLPVDLVDLIATEGPVQHEALNRGHILLGEGGRAHEEASLRMIWWQDDFAPLYRQAVKTVLAQAFQ